MEEIKFKFKLKTVDGTYILIGKQHFESLFAENPEKTGTVLIMKDGKLFLCNMFHGSDGDIGFIFEKEPYYFGEMVSA